MNIFDGATDKIFRLHRAGIISLDGSSEFSKVSISDDGNITHSFTSQELDNVSTLDVFFNDNINNVLSFESILAGDIYTGNVLENGSGFPTVHFPGKLDRAKDSDMQGLWMLFNASVDQLTEDQGSYDLPSPMILPGGQVVPVEGIGDIIGYEKKAFLLLRYTSFSKTMRAAIDGSGDKMLYSNDKYLSEYLVKFRGSIYLTSYQAQPERAV